MTERLIRVKRLWESQLVEIQGQSQKLTAIIQSEKMQNQALNQIMQEYHNGEDTYNALDLKARVQFRHNLQRAITNQKKKITQLEARLAELNHLYMQFHLRIKNLTTIIEKRTAKLKSEQFKAEMKMLEAMYLQYKQHYSS